MPTASTETAQALETDMNATDNRLRTRLRAVEANAELLLQRLIEANGELEAYRAQYGWPLAAKAAAVGMNAPEDFRIVCCEACGSEGRIYYGECDDGFSEPCPYCEGTGGEIIPVEPITLDDLLNPSQAAVVRHLESVVDALQAELDAAKHELSCCDDIPLDQGLVVGISELQADRERLRAAISNSTPPKQNLLKTQRMP